MIRELSALVLATALATGAAAQGSPPAPAAPAATCAECGVVRSVKRVESRPAITAEERKSTAGFVASIPLGGGKSTVGSSTDVRSEQKPPTVRYEVVVRLDDGRFQVVMQDDAGGLVVGDKVRVDRGKVVRREQ